MSGAISETVSEIRPKRKRGRPRLLSAEEEAYSRGTWYEARSLRSHQNRSYAMRAWGLIRLESCFDYFADPPTGDRIKWTILAELGRIADGDEVRNLARTICEHRIPARAAVRALRKGRLGRSPRNDFADALSRFVDERRRLDPDLTLEEVISGLDAIRDAVQEVNDQ